MAVPGTVTVCSSPEVLYSVKVRFCSMHSRGPSPDLGNLHHVTCRHSRGAGLPE